MRVGAIAIDGKRELCLIRNISAGGMMIRAYSPIPIGTRLSVELKQGDPVEGAVQWVEDGLTGVAFDEPIDVVLVAFRARRRTSPAPAAHRGRLHRLGPRGRRRRANARGERVARRRLRDQSEPMLTVGADVVVTLPGPRARRRRREMDAMAEPTALRSTVRWFCHDLVAWLKDQQQEQRSRAA